MLLRLPIEFRAEITSCLTLCLCKTLFAFSLKLGSFSLNQQKCRASLCGRVFFIITLFDIVSSPHSEKGVCPCPSENCVACKSSSITATVLKLYRHVELLTIMCRCAPEVLFLDTLINPLRISVQYIYHVIFCCAQLKMYESHNHETLQAC